MPHETIKQFEKELKELINKHCLENCSNTPDFILAEYLVDCLKNYEKIHNANEKWYGRRLEIEMPNKRTNR